MAAVIRNGDWNILIFILLYCCISVSSADTNRYFTNVKLLRHQIAAEIKQLQEFIKTLDDQVVKEISITIGNDRINKNKIDLMETEVNIMANNITNELLEILKLSNIEELNELTSRIKFVENKLTTINNYFDNATISGLNIYLDYYNETFENNFVVISRNLTEKMAVLKQKILLKQDEILSKECIDEFNAERYYKAVEKLEKIINIENIDYIVNKIIILDNKKLNTDKILIFTEMINDIGKSFQIYKSLLKLNFWKNIPTRIGKIQNLVQFIKSLNNEITYEINTTNKILEEAGQIEDKVVGELFVLLLEDFDLYKYTRNHDWCDKELLRNIIELDVTSLNKLYSKILKRKNTYDYLNFVNVMLFTRINCIKHVYREDSNIIIKLAHIIKYLKSYELSIYDISGTLNTHENGFPNIIKMLIFSDQICLKNIKQNKYLTSEQNNVTLTMLTSSQDVQGQSWHIVWHTTFDNFYLKNVHTNKYLSIVDRMGHFKLNKENDRQLYLTEQKLTIWKIQLKQFDYCFIRALNSEDYLYYLETFGGLLRVGSRSTNDGEEFNWDIVNCKSSYFL